MPAKKPTAEDKLIGRFNWAAFRLGALHGRDLIDDKTATRLFKSVNAVGIVVDAQDKLKSDGTNSGLVKGLDKPISQLRQTFVRQMDAVVRKLDKTKLTQRERKVLQV